MALKITSKFRLQSRQKAPSFRFDRPLLIIQSDDWGRVGVRDRSGFEQLRAAGVPLGQNPYDYYSLETGDDIGALHELLLQHRDSAGRAARVVMNFITANLDFERMRDRTVTRIALRPLHDGLPGKWRRPGLLDAYRAGVADGVFHPALHGTTHFCSRAMERELEAGGQRSELLHTFWDADTPYVFSHMPWVGYEYWDPERRPKDRQLSLDEQAERIEDGVAHFGVMFGKGPTSACAPGYRADRATHQAWLRAGIRVAQNGPAALAPHFSEDGILQLYRNVQFEPATDRAFSVANCLRATAECFARGIPAIVCMHSINLHSSLKDFRTRTLAALDQLLSELQKAYPTLLYITDEDLHAIVTRGACDAPTSSIKVGVSQLLSGRSAAVPA